MLLFFSVMPIEEGESVRREHLRSMTAKLTEILIEKMSCRCYQSPENHRHPCDYRNCFFILTGNNNENRKCKSKRDNPAFEPPDNRQTDIHNDN
jgi:hypothetical protein